MHYSIFIEFLKYFLIFFSITSPLLLLAQNSDEIQNDKFTIVFDPGHGGKDIGTSGLHLIEKDVTFSLSEEISRAIVTQRPEINIKFTREDDDFIPIHKRVAYANNLDADLFISVHCNAVKSHQPHGIETYVLGTQDHQENLETVKRENSAILYESDFKTEYEGFDPTSPSGHIYFSAIQNRFMNEGILLAHKIQTKFSDMNVMRDRGVKQAGFVVLRKATMPAILLEVGYLSNPADEKKLMNNYDRNKIVNRIANGIIEYVAPLIAKSVEQQLTLSKEKQESQSIIINKADPKPELKHTEKLFYSVLIASSANGEIPTLKDNVILGQRVVSETNKNRVEYSIGQFANLKEALDLQMKARANGYNGAYAYKKMIPIVLRNRPSDVKIQFSGVN